MKLGEFLAVANAIIEKLGINVMNAEVGFAITSVDGEKLESPGVYHIDTLKLGVARGKEKDNPLAEPQFAILALGDIVGVPDEFRDKFVKCQEDDGGVKEGMFSGFELGEEELNIEKPKPKPNIIGPILGQRNPEVN